LAVKNLLKQWFFVCQKGVVFGVLDKVFVVFILWKKRDK